MRKPPLHLFLTWLGLLALLAVNIGLARLGVGGFAAGLTILVAAVMALLVACIFMELGGVASLYWVFAGAGFFWLAILFCMTATDYLTRYSFAPL